jgi:hypothetical protein
MLDSSLRRAGVKQPSVRDMLASSLLSRVYADEGSGSVTGWMAGQLIRLSPNISLTGGIPWSDPARAVPVETEIATLARR